MSQQEHQFWQLPAPNARGSFDSLALQTGPKPKPGPGEVLVAVKAASLNFRDLIIALGKYPLDKKDAPTIPASDGAGEVVAVGEGVTKFKPKDRVAAIFNAGHQRGSTPNRAEKRTGLGGSIDGMLSQYRALPETALVHIPQHLSWEEAATLPCAAVTAWNGLFGLPSNVLQPGETVVCEGTGGVSVFGAQFAIAAGAKVVITSSSDEKLDRVRKLFFPGETGAPHHGQLQNEPGLGQGSAQGVWRRRGRACARRRRPRYARKGLQHHPARWRCERHWLRWKGRGAQSLGTRAGHDIRLQGYSCRIEGNVRADERRH